MLSSIFQEKTVSEEKEVKTVKVELSWWPFWMAGWLFSIGIGAIQYGENYGFWQLVLEIVYTWFLWPLILGAHFNG